MWSPFSSSVVTVYATVASHLSNQSIQFWLLIWKKITEESLHQQLLQRLSQASVMWICPHLVMERIRSQIQAAALLHEESVSSLRDRIMIGDVREELRVERLQLAVTQEMNVEAATACVSIAAAAFAV